MFNKYNSVSSQFNKHSRQYRHYVVDATTNQFQDLMCQKKYNLVSMSQLNTVNNTDTVIDLNLNPLHLIDQSFSMDQIRDKYSAIKKRTNQWRKGNLKNEAETRCQSNTQKWFDHRLITASKCHSGLSTLS